MHAITNEQKSTINDYLFTKRPRLLTPAIGAWQVTSHQRLLTLISGNNKPPMTTDTDQSPISIQTSIGGSKKPPVTIATNRVIGGSKKPPVTVDSNHVTGR